MRRIRLLIIGLFSVIGVIFGGSFFKKALSISLCGLLGFNSISGIPFLSDAGYAADGLHNFMVKLNQKYGSNQNIFASHPATTERISYLEQLIVRNGYNRYSYEGVEKHAAIQKRLR